MTGGNVDFIFYYFYFFNSNKLVIHFKAVDDLLLFKN